MRDSEASDVAGQLHRTPAPRPRGRRGRLYGLLLLAACIPSASEPAGQDAVAAGWPVYRGNHGSSAYSPLTAINRGNVAALEVAWTFRSGDASEGSRSTIQTNPLMADGKLFVVSPRSRIFALDPASGEALWEFEPEQSGIVRGLSYWADGDDRRILVPIQRHLYALRAQDGTLVESFGDGGKVDTRHGLGRDPESISINHTSPGVVFEDLIILGSSVGEGYGAAPGHIRAYDVRTGELVWTFHTIPQPGEYGYQTWPEDAHRRVGGVNAWSGMSLDPLRETVYAATGSAAFDFYGGDREGENLFANSVIAIDARTGERRWHYQVVHHDIWDYDLPAPPTLVTVRHDGRRVDAVAQVTKQGFVFVLDRDTGEPLFPVEERPVPQGGVPGERPWPTQPVPLRPAPLVRQTLTEADLTDISPEARASVLERFRELRPGPMYTPPSLQGTLFAPGTLGGAEWSGAAFDPELGLLYVNSNELPSVVQLLPREHPSPDLSIVEAGRRLYLANACAGCHGADRRGNAAFPALLSLDERLPRESVAEVIRQGRGGMPAFSHLTDDEMEALLAYLLATGGDAAEAEESGAAVRETHLGERPYANAGYEKLRDHLGRPGIKPPWGTLAAVDLHEGEIAWQIPLGEYPGVDEVHQPTGTPMFGGAIVTAGGLVFIGATMDEKIRALDKGTGAILWEHDLPAGGYATPATFEHEGRQYVVIAAGGGGRSGTPSGDSYLAFALPLRPMAR